MLETRKALISVWDKTGVLELAKGLAAHGYEIVSSSGTAKHLREGGTAASLFSMRPLSVKSYKKGRSWKSD